MRTRGDPRPNAPGARFRGFRRAPNSSLANTTNDCRRRQTNPSCCARARPNERSHRERRAQVAAKVARGYLDRMDAWSVDPFATDPAIGSTSRSIEPAELSKAQLAERRVRWMEREKARLTGGDQGTRAALEQLGSRVGGFAENRAEALEAIAQMPRSALPLGNTPRRRSRSHDWQVLHARRPFCRTSSPAPRHEHALIAR